MTTVTTRPTPLPLLAAKPKSDAVGAPSGAAASTVQALLVRQPWVSLLCRGEKTWELRGSRTHKRGRVALVASGEGGRIVGGATLVACHGPLSAEQLEQTQALHRVPAAAGAGRRYRHVWAWEFAAAASLPLPVAYVHPPGAVIWVNLQQPVHC